MVLNIPEGGVLLEGSANTTAELPSQAFAIALSGSVIEDMIACVQNGGDIQLALGSNPKFLFDDHEIRIPKTSDPSGYDLFLTDSDHPSTAARLPNPTMSIFRVPKHKLKPKPVKVPRLVAAKGDSAAKKPPARPPVKSSTTTSNAAARPASASARDSDRKAGMEDAAARLERSLASLEADKRENAAVIVGALPGSKGAKLKANSRLLGAASPRSLPPSPALSGIGSPSLLPSGNTAQEKVKQHRFPILHELAVQDLSREDLWAKWDEGTEDEFNAALNKVADFDKAKQKWVLKRNSWKDLDVFEYYYDLDEDRQKAISNAVRVYDRLRISTSDPLWQKLLPKSDRGKGICLSKLQAAIVNGPAVPAPRQKADGASTSGGDSEKEGKGGEPMSRSSSQTSTGKKKLSASEAQAKRLLSKKKGAAATTTKAAPKTTTAKPAAKAAPPKGGRVLSKEFVSDSSSSDDEEPLSTSVGKPKASAVPAKPAQKPADKPKPAEKTAEPAAPKPKPAAAAKPQPREQKSAKEQDTIRAQVIAKPNRPTAKRPRDADDDDSSSSGTPLSKRVKPAPKPLPAPVSSARARAPSDASQNSRATGQTGQGVTSNKPKNTSPVKSSPLASSPPTNASDMEQDRAALARARERQRERERGRDTAIRSSSSSSSNTDSNGGAAITARKRPPTDALPATTKAKRHRPSQETIEMAAKFKQFYARYQQLHHDISTNDNPDPGKVTDLLDMHERLSRMKTEIYAAVEV